MKIHLLIVFAYCLFSSLIEASCEIPAGTYTGYWDDHVNLELGDDAKNIVSKLIIPPYGNDGYIDQIAVKILGRKFFNDIYTYLPIKNWSVSFVDKDEIERQFDLNQSLTFKCDSNTLIISRYYDRKYLHLLLRDKLAEWRTGVRIEFPGFLLSGKLIIVMEYKNGQLVSDGRAARFYLTSYFSGSSVVLDQSRRMVIFNHDN